MYDTDLENCATSVEIDNYYTRRNIMSYHRRVKHLSEYIKLRYIMYNITEWDYELIKQEFLSGEWRKFTNG